MKSLFLTVTTDLSYDQRMMRIAGTLATRYDVRLIGRRRDISVPLAQRPYRQVRLRCFFQRGKLFYAEMNLRLFWHLLTNRFDVVCGCDLDTILPCYLAARLKRKPCVYDAHEIFTEIPELAHRPLIRRIWLSLERFVIPRIRHAYTVNESLAELFHQRYGSSFSVIRNVSALRVPEETGRDDRYIFYQGVLNVGRGLEPLIEAMPGLDIKLVLAGEGDISESLRQRVRELGLSERVVFLGFVSPGELIPLTQRAAIGVNLRARLGLNDYYSLANKFFDYIHAAVPQITMSFPEYARINAEHEVAILIDDLEKSTISEAINRLAGDRELYERLRANCLAAREVYNWEEEGKKLLAIYGSITGEAGSSVRADSGTERGSPAPSP